MEHGIPEREEDVAEELDARAAVRVARQEVEGVIAVDAARDSGHGLDLEILELDVLEHGTQVDGAAERADRAEQVDVLRSEVQRAVATHRYPGDCAALARTRRGLPGRIRDVIVVAVRAAPAREEREQKKRRDRGTPARSAHAHRTTCPHHEAPLLHQGSIAATASSGPTQLTRGRVSPRGVCKRSPGVVAFAIAARGGDSDQRNPSLRSAASESKSSNWISPSRV